MKFKMSFIFFSILLVLWGCSNDTDEAKEKSKEVDEVAEQTSKEKGNYEDELTTVQETIDKYRTGLIEKDQAVTTVEKHIANLESIDSNEKDVSPVIQTLKGLKENLNQKEVNEINVLKNMVEVENELNKVNSQQVEEGESDTMINVTKAKGLLRNSFAPIVGNVSYNIEGTVNNTEISEIVLNFTAVVDGVENLQSVTVPVKEGNFAFTKGYEEVFGYFKELEITAKKADGTLVKDSSGNEISIKETIDLTVME